VPEPRLPLNSSKSHALASRQSRITLSGEIFNTAAAPQKKRPTLFQFLPPVRASRATASLDDRRGREHRRTQSSQPDWLVLFSFSPYQTRCFPRFKFSAQSSEL